MLEWHDLGIILQSAKLLFMEEKMFKFVSQLRNHVKKSHVTHVQPPVCLNNLTVAPILAQAGTALVYPKHKNLLDFNTTSSRNLKNPECRKLFWIQISSNSRLSLNKKTRPRNHKYRGQRNGVLEMS